LLSGNLRFPHLPFSNIRTRRKRKVTTRSEQNRKSELTFINKTKTTRNMEKDHELDANDEKNEPKQGKTTLETEEDNVENT
jgi:hypothetical protein